MAEYALGWYERYKASPIAAALVIASGAVIILSVFLPWLPGANGYSFMTSNKAFLGSGNFLFSWGSGALFLSGFWGLLFGALAIVGGLMMFGEGIRGTSLAIFSCFMVLALAILNIVMIFVKSSVFSADPATGLWLLGVSAFVGMIVAGTGT